MGNTVGNCCGSSRGKEDDFKTLGGAFTDATKRSLNRTKSPPLELKLPVHMKIVESKKVKGLRLQSLRSYSLCELLVWLIGFGRPEFPIREPTDPHNRQPLAFPTSQTYPVHFLVDCGQENAENGIRFIGECLPNSRTPCGLGIAYFPEHMVIVLGKWEPSSKEPEIMSQFKLEKIDTFWQVVTLQKLRMTSKGLQLETVSQETTLNLTEVERT